MREELDGDEEYIAQIDEEIIASNKAIMESIWDAYEKSLSFPKHLPQ